MATPEPIDPPRRFAIATLGCKVNQYEAQALRERLTALGWRETPFREPAELYVINTCTVTAAADEKCRQEVHRAHRANPQARIVVTGCAAQTDAKRYAAMAGVSAVLTREQVAGIGAWLRDGAAPAPGDVFDLSVSGFAGHTRAFLKIEDGCDAGCAYCIVPRARGAVRSRPLAGIRAEAQRLVEAGFAEIVLTGIHLGFYGRDLGQPAGVAAAARAVLERPGVRRLRLSSIEALEVSDALLDLAAGDARFCPHFHIPLQSGDDGVLAAMRRRYTAGEFLRVLERVRARLDRPSITTDVMVGFPGETEAAFENTAALCRQAGFSRMHIFPFSPRPGTRAAAMPGRLAPEALHERAARLEAVAKELALAYKRPFIGQVVEPLVEGRRDRRTGRLTGWTERYVKVLFEGPDALAGRLAAVRVTGATAAHLTGERL